MTVRPHAALRFTRLPLDVYVADCGAWAGNAGRCKSCARHAYVRSGEHRGLPAWPARFIVIEIDTGERHGSFDSEAELDAYAAWA